MTSFTTDHLEGLIHDLQRDQDNEQLTTWQRLGAAIALHKATGLLDTLRTLKQGQSH